MQGYLILTSPALFLMTADFYHMLLEQNKKRKLKWICIPVMALLLALPVRYSIERLKPFEQTERNPQWTRDLRELGGEEITNGVLFNYPNYIEAMFYTGIPVYDHIPDRIVLTDLLARGHTILMNDKGNIPTEIASMDGILLVRMAIKE